MVIGVTLDFWSQITHFSPALPLPWWLTFTASEPWAAGHRETTWSFPSFLKRPRWKQDPDSALCLKDQQFSLNSLVQRSLFGHRALCRVFPWSRECQGGQPGGCWGCSCARQGSSHEPELPQLPSPRCCTGHLQALPLQMHTAGIGSPLGEGFRCDFTQEQAGTLCAGWGESWALQEPAEDIQHCLEQGEHPGLGFVTIYLFISQHFHYLLWLMGVGPGGQRMMPEVFFIFQEAAHWFFFFFLYFHSEGFSTKHFCSRID